MTSTVVIQADGIEKSYAKKKAVDGASITVQAGTIHVLLGRNGSGKTTLAKILAGVLSMDAGTISAPGIAGTVFGPAFRKHVGFLFDSTAHWDSLTGEENAWFYSRSFGLKPGEANLRIGRLFARLSLEAVSNDPVSTYSFGMRRKLAIAEAVAHEPRLLILDEPSMGLDYASRESLYSMLRENAAQGQAVLIATNDLNEARHLADFVSLIERGKVIISGTPADLIRQLDGRVFIEVEVTAPFALDRIRSVPGVIDTSVLPGRDRLMFRVTAKADAEGSVTRDLVGLLAASGIGIARIDVRRPDLDDVFLRFAEGGGE